MRKTIIPPGGFQGFGQQTPAVQALLRSPATRTRRKTRGKPAGRKKAASPARRKATRRAAPKRRTSRGKKPYLVKGSAAAKRHMAKLRKMRKRG